MKKAIKITLAILFASLFIGMSYIRADFNCTVGTVNTYEVNDSEWDFSVGPNSSSGTGFQFDDANFAEGTQFTAEVTSASASAVGYTQAAGTHTKSYTTSPFDFLGIVLYMLYPLLLASIVSATWDQAEMDLGPGLVAPAFIEPQYANLIFYNLSQDAIASSELSTDDEWTFTAFGGTFDNSSDVAVFQWSLDGSYVNSTTNTDFSGTYSYDIAYDQTTGELMGARVDLDYSGTVGGTILDLDMLQEFEMLGYNLPGGGLLGGFIPGFEWFIAIPALALVGLISIAIKRRK